MKTITIFFAVFILTAALNAQDFITYSGDGKVVLLDGTTMEGLVEFSLSAPATVTIKVGDNKAERYKAKEVKEFFVNAKHYFPLKAKGEVSVGSDLSFSYIISADDARIRLYKNETQPIVSAGGAVPVTTTIYACLPGSEGEVYPLSAMGLNPSTKLAKYFEDCAALVEKITKKEKGYSYGMITTDEIRQSIIEKFNLEYAGCK